MHEVLELKEKHKPAIDALCASHTKMFRSSMNMKSVFVEDTLFSRLVDPKNQAVNGWGAFDEHGELRSFLISAISPYNNLYFVRHLKAASSGFGIYRNGLPQAWNKMLEFHEALGIFRFMFVRSVQKWPQARTAKQFYEKAPLFYRYSRVIEAFIPAGGRSPVDFIDKLLGMTVWDHDSVLEHAVLKQKFRPHADILLDWM